MMNRDEYRQMLLAGSVTFPATFPQVGRLTLLVESRPARPSDQLEILAVEEYPSPRVTLTRRVLAAKVRAVFLPRDARAVHFTDGQWLLEDEIVAGLKQRLADGPGPVFGIVFVPESEPSMLHVSAGMTAAESSQYYPPLPNDPSHNHYNPWPSSSGLSNSGLSNSGGLSSALGGAVGSSLGGPYSSVPQRACSAADAATIFMHSCASMDPLWELERAKAMSIAAPDHSPIAPTAESQPLMNSCTVSHIGLPSRDVWDAQPHAVAAASIQPFPTDDL